MLVGAHFPLDSFIYLFFSSSLRSAISHSVRFISSLKMLSQPGRFLTYLYSMHCISMYDSLSMGIWKLSLGSSTLYRRAADLASLGKALLKS